MFCLWIHTLNTSQKLGQEKVTDTNKGRTGLVKFFPASEGSITFSEHWICRKHWPDMEFICLS